MFDPMSHTPETSASAQIKADPSPAEAAGAGPAAQDASAEAKPASHDSALPQALIDFMLQRWAPAPRELPPAIEHAEVFAARRRALSKLFPAETLVIPTGHEKVRSNDTHYRFRPGSDFYYLTGNLEPDCVLVMQPQEGGGHRDILFVEPNPGRSDKTFFTDRVKGELWVGPRLGVEQSRVRFGLDECRGLPELDAYLAGLLGTVTRPHRVFRGVSERVDSAVPRQDRDKQLAETLSEMRLLKDAVELEELDAVMASTKRGFEDVIRALPGGRSEREVEGIFNLRARVEGNDVGYGTIAASGPHACILHWTRNDGKLEPGTLLLLDAGVEGNTLYTADITRTLPISGRFSPEQRAIYEIVLEAQQAAFAEVKPGNDFMDPNRAAMRVIARGLERLGILPTSAEEALKEEKQFYRRYSLHNVSHMLGLDVHDCAQARQEAYKFGKLKAGMVLTVEPGLYFQLDDETVPVRYRGIGVRIEDDVVVTETGYRNLSADIPSAADAVEAWMASLWAEGRAAR
jgi:Xaa-Pro aminopeptidase